MIIIQQNTASEAWEESIRILISKGTILMDSEIGSPFCEICNVIMEVKSPLSEPIVSQFYQFPELLKQYDLTDKSSFLEVKHLDDRLHRWPVTKNTFIDQIRSVILLLKKNLFSRRAVIVLWNPATDFKDKTPICPCYIQFRAHPTKNDSPVLDMSVVIRSSDAWMGAMLDIRSFISLQSEIAKKIKIHVGSYLHHVISYHIYQHDIPSAVTAFKEEENETSSLS